jgi:hypothetical protein
MEGFYIDPFMTQQNDWVMLVNKRLISAPWKKKGPRCIVNSLQLNCLVSSYNHHFVVFTKIEKYDKLVPNQVWKVVYYDYKLQLFDFAFQQESL